MTNYSELRHAGKLHGTIKSAKIKRKARDELRIAGRPSLAPGFRAIVLGETDESAAFHLSRKDRPRVQRWVSPMAETRRSTRREDGTVRHNPAPPAWRVCEDDAGAYGGRHYRNFRMIDYTPTVASYGRATATRLYASVWAIPYKYRAPRGWKFGNDYLGIYLVRKKEQRHHFRHHLTSDDIRGGLAAMRRAGITHEDNQRAVAAQKRAET